MKNLAFFSLFLMTFFISAQTKITKNLGDFTTIKVYNGINIVLKKSDENKIEITGEKAEKVSVKNKNNTLKISLKLPETIADNKVAITLFYNNILETIDANEGSVITSKEISQPKIEIKAQEGAFINMLVNVKHLDIKSSSGGVIKLSGSTKNQTVNADLGGIYHGYNLEVSDLNYIRAGSGSKVEVDAGETLDVKVSFGGSVFYKGKPEVFKKKKVIGGVIEHRS